MGRMITRTDAEIAADVRDALEWDVLVPSDTILSSVANGVVTLDGTVDVWSQYDDAARAVGNVAGVRDVVNRLVVAPADTPPQNVRRAIDEALERHATHAAKHIRIAVHNGTVVLYGAVPSWAERTAVEITVRGTPGVLHVDNQLRVHS